MIFLIIHKLIQIVGNNPWKSGNTKDGDSEKRGRAVKTTRERVDATQLRGKRAFSALYNLRRSWGAKEMKPCANPPIEFGLKYTNCSEKC